MNNDGNDSLKNAFNEVVGDKELKLCFLHSDKTTNLKEETKIEIMKTIIRKTMHAMSKQVTKRYNEEYTGHYSKNGGDTALRQKLKANSQLQSAKKKLELDERTKQHKKQKKDNYSGK